MGMGVGVGPVHHSPRDICVSSPPPQVGPRLLQCYHEWALVMENQFVLEVACVRAFLVSHSASAVKFVRSLFSPSRGHSKREALMAEIQAMVTKGAVIPLPQDSGSRFYCNLFLVTKFTGGCWPVINLEPLIWFLHNPRFKVETS